MENRRWQHLPAQDEPESGLSEVPERRRSRESAEGSHAAAPGLKTTISPFYRGDVEKKHLICAPAWVRDEDDRICPRSPEWRYFAGEQRKRPHPARSQRDAC